MISAIEMRILDRNAQYAGISILDLMEEAGKAVAEAARSEFSVAGKRVLVLCGPGNNGGDGLVAARYLAKDAARVTVLLTRSPDEFSTREAATNFERLRDVEILAGVDRSAGALAEADVIIDALLGIGLQGTLKEPFASLVHEVNASEKPVLSVDVPSGFGTGLAIRPQVTVALHDAKEGMTPENSGRIRIADIGIPPRVATMTGPGEFLLYPIPRATSHKGQNGRVLVIAGGPYTGAPALVGFGALGVGGDLVHIATPALAATVVASYSPVLIVHPLVGHRLMREDLRRILDLMPRADAAAIGPGLGDVDGTLDAIREIVRNLTIPVVIDADAIKAVAEDPRCLAGKKVVLTPHSREFQTLTGKSLPDPPEERGEIVREAAKSFGATILLKGPVDIVSDGTRLKFNYTHNVGMTVGGTGDVLCGVTAGLVAKGMGLYDAARLAAFINGAAGNLAFEQKSYGLTSVDVADNLGRVLAKYL
ncbi:MAG TPA: NAD(P)H-hydrate dehydratase [Thermoplasmata archaeon]|nr:NAD(P)H-hydrate dehydratase [Thermoplasmata archaeon]